MKKITLIFLFLFSMFSFGQSVTITELKVLNYDATTVNFGVNVNSVNVSLKVNVVSPYNTQRGTVIIRYKKYGNSSGNGLIPTNGADTDFYLPNGVSYSKTYKITLYRSDFEDTGGVLYVEYFPTPLSTYAYKSSNINVTRLPDPIRNNTIRDDQTIDEGDQANAVNGTLPTGGNETFTYLWQEKSGFGSWTTVPESPSRSYLPGYLTKTTSYRRIVKSPGVSDNISNEVTITVIPSVPIQNNQINLSGSTISGSLPTGGKGSYTYRWYANLVDGEDWALLQGTDKDLNIPDYVYSFAESQGHELFIYREVKSGNKISNSQAVKISPLQPIQNNGITLNGSTVLGNLPTGGTGSYVYKWYTNLVDGEDWALLQGTGKDLTIPDYVYGFAESQGHELFIYREVKSGNKISNSQAVKISPLSPIENNTITINGLNIDGSLPTGGSGSYRYEYYSYLEFPDGEIEGPSMMEGTGQNYMFSVKPSPIIKFYRRVVSGNKSSNSNVVSFPSAKSATNKAALSANSISDLTVYPNPTSESINFATNFTTDQNIEIVLYSEKLGNEKSVYKGKVSPNQIVNWRIPANYQKGLYFYKILSENKEVKSGKVIFN